MNCTFQNADNRCPCCGIIAPGPHWQHNCPSDLGGPSHPQDESKIASCVHRGAEVRREQCQTCSDLVQIKIIACSVHGECEMAGKITGVKFCGLCADFEAAAEAKAEAS